jgi:hypothetical protein
MRTIFMTILMVAIVLSGYRFFIASDTTGLWRDTKTIRDKSDVVLEQHLAPAP